MLLRGNELLAACHCAFVRACLPAEGGGVRLEGVALSWRDGQAFYVPLHQRPDLAAELAPLFATPALEKATWDLRGQLAALLKALGPGALGTPQVALATEAPFAPAAAAQGAEAAQTTADAALALCDPLVDVRVAAWLCTPENKALSEAVSGCSLSDLLKCVDDATTSGRAWGVSVAFTALACVVESSDWWSAACLLV